MPEHKRRKHDDGAEPQENRPTEKVSEAGMEVAPGEGDEALPAETIEGLSRELDEARQKANDYFEGWQRERADFSNYKRRVDRERATMQENLVGNIVKKYLVVVDDLERALVVKPTQGEAASWAEGIDLIYRKLQNILESEGVHRMEVEGQMFDPNRHEALAQIDSPDHPSGAIIDVIQPGYTIGDRVLRPALVRVAA